MEVILDNKSLTCHFERLCESYAHFEWAVAWAGDDNGFREGELLKQYSTKIVKMIVGLHFYQTHPNFIKRYLGHPAVRFNPLTDELFHSKIYLFYNNDTDWAAIIGSANFTNSAFHKNYEANVLIQSTDANSSINELKDYIAHIWDKCKCFTVDDLKNYERCYHFQSEKHRSLKTVSKGNKAFATSPIQLMDWKTFYIGVMNDSAIFARLKILDKAKKLLANSFESIDNNYKKCLAGFVSYMPGMDDVDWKLFGSMVGAGAFKKSIMTDDELAKALDGIPLEGNVSKVQFVRYCEAFKKIYQNPLGCATRMLALKRPDLFVCVDSKNKKSLCKAFAIKNAELTLDTYWELIIEPLQDALWVKEPIENPNQKKVKAYQVALLDSLYYEYL